MFFNFAMPSLIMAVLTYGMHSPLPDGWNRVDVSTISFRGGDIDSSSLKSFTELVDHRTDTLILTSRGGDVDAAIGMGREIHGRGISVVVRGYCVSSCANYLFLSGRRRIIEPNSFVGFHGTVTSMDIERLIARIKSSGEAAGKQDEEVEMDIRYARSDIERLRSMERDFATLVGFSQSLLIESGFERLSDSAKKTLPEYPVLFPSAETLNNCYGILGVEDQSRAENPNLDTLGERGAPGLGFTLLGDDWFTNCD